MRNALTVGLAATAMMVVLAVTDAQGQAAIDVCVSVTPVPAPLYVREPRIIHVPLSGVAMGRRRSESAAGQAIIIHRHVSRASSRHDRHSHKTPLPRQKPAILVPAPAVLATPTMNQPVPPPPQAAGKPVQPEKTQSSGSADITATVPPAAVSPAAVAAPVPVAPEPAQLAPSPSPAGSEPAVVAPAEPGPDAPALPADAKPSASSAPEPQAQ